MLKFDFLMANILGSTITLHDDFSIEVINHTNFDLATAFGNNNKVVTYDMVQDLLNWRCFPKDRENCKELLSDIGLKTYDNIAILKETHGVMTDDWYWIRFDGEDLTFEDVRKKFGLSYDIDFRVPENGELTFTNIS